jgi:hypothetical protein
METAAVLLRPRGALELVDAAAALLRRRTGDLALIAAVTVVPVIVFSFLAGVNASEDVASRSGGVGSLAFDQGDVNFGLLIVEILIGSMLFSVVAFAMTRYIVSDLFGQSESAASALWAAVRRAQILVPLWVVVHIASVGGIFLIATVALALTVPALAAEPGHSIFSAFRRSWNLTKGARGHVFGVLLVLMLVNSVLGLVLVIAPASLVGTFLGGWNFVIVSTGLQAVASLVTEAIVAATTVYLYLDLRVRREGLDLDLRLRRTA